jgi:signal transduction histidine kinase
MGVGLSLFLLSFYGLTFFASYLAGIGIFKDSRIEMYGLFGMAGFLVFISTLIVQYKIFNVNLFSSQALVLGLIILTGSQLTLEPNQTSAILTIITILLTIVTGWFLIRGVKREIAHGKEIEKLASSLEKANARLQALDRQKSEFVSIASHQLRSPLAAIRGYTSMLLDGTYGSMTSKATGALDRIHESAKLMAFSIEDFLNVSRIESGNMKYELTDFNLKEQAEHIVDDLRPEAVRAGLILLIKSNITSQGIVHADIGKTQQILHNLINNALKYTQKGTITVFIQEQKKQKKLVVEFIDTGIGMSQETIGELFEKFSRAKNANTVNIKGTGLGLFVAREMARAMGGDITAHSEGEDKGSRFILTLPLVT